MSDIPVSYRGKLEHCPYQSSGFTKLEQLDNTVENGGGNAQKMQWIISRVSLFK